MLVSPRCYYQVYEIEKHEFQVVSIIFLLNFVGALLSILDFKQADR
jgi:hypothetical protein